MQMNTSTLSELSVQTLAESIGSELAHCSDNRFMLDLSEYGYQAVGQVAEALAIHAMNILDDVERSRPVNERSADGYDYIRKHYTANPQVGRQVLVNDKEVRGIVVPAVGHGHYLHVVCAGDETVSLFHPKDVTWMPVAPRALTEDEMMAFAASATPEWDLVDLVEFVEETTGRAMPARGVKPA